MPKYDDIEVQLVGNDGNAFAIIANVRGEMREAGVPKEEIDQYLEEAMAGDYDNLLRVSMEWVNVT